MIACSLASARTLGSSGYPARLELLTQGVPNAQDPKGGLLYFLRRLPRDPLHTDPSVSAADTWGLRAYDSPADAPQPGRDVFDVYSLSPATGLNGTGNLWSDGTKLAVTHSSTTRKLLPEIMTNMPSSA